MYVRVFACVCASVSVCERECVSVSVCARLCEIVRACM